MSSYELIGIKIYGIVSNGSGGNTSFFKLINGNHSLQGKWISKEFLRTTNHVDCTRSIYIWSCATRSLKALRNNLFRSQLKLTRKLRNNGTIFGRKDVDAIYMRDSQRTDNNLIARTDIVKYAIVLDEFTMMNASYAKQIFSEKLYVKSYHTYQSSYK